MPTKLTNAILSVFKKETNNLDSLYSYIDAKHIPMSGSKAGKLLIRLLDGKAHEKSELVKLLEDDPRSPLQELGGKPLGHWLIHNIAPKGQRGIYQIDPLHLSGNIADDRHARKIKRLSYATSSKHLAILHSSRLSTALTEYESALKAANDPDFQSSLEEIADE